MVGGGKHKSRGLGYSGAGFYVLSNLGQEQGIAFITFVEIRAPSEYLSAGPFFEIHVSAYDI